MARPRSFDEGEVPRVTRDQFGRSALLLHVTSG
jgi:hypothetical protein